MKNLFTLFMSMFLALAVSAQVTVTLKVDVTNYIQAGNTIAAEGLRVGGNFAALGATNSNGDAITDWAPADAASAMTDEGNNIWSIEVTYPSTAVGDTQQYKFVNGDWGMNEGVDTTAIADDGCGIDDGSGNINRILEVPSSDVGYQFCWDLCVRCDGSSPLLVTGINEFTNLNDINAYPNPVSSSTVILYSLDNRVDNLEITVMDALGRNIATLYNGSQVAGNHQIQWDASNMNSGVYFYTFSNGESMITKKLMVTK